MNQGNNDPILLRRTLHEYAEPSGEEHRTAEIVRDYLQTFEPDDLLSQLGGHGLAAVYRSGKPGPLVLFRCELDALPIPETLTCDHASRTEGISHKCGHDGHMAIVSGLAPLLKKKRPQSGGAALLYQPSEEAGEGAARLLQDPSFRAIQPDYVFALHNLPGFPLGEVIWRDGVFSASSPRCR